MAEVISSPSYYEIDLVRNHNGFKAARRTRANRNIAIHCLNMVGSGLKAEFFDYEKIGDDGVVVNERIGLRAFGVKRRYIPGTPEHKAFEQLSKLDLEAGL